MLCVIYNCYTYVCVRVNNWFHTAIVGAFVHIRNFLFCARASSGFLYETTYTACNECLAFCDVHLVHLCSIKHQAMQQTILCLLI